MRRERHPDLGVANIEIGVMVHLLRGNSDAIHKTDSRHERGEREGLDQRLAFSRPARERCEFALEFAVRHFRSRPHQNSLAVSPPRASPACIPMLLATKMADIEIQRE